MPRPETAPLREPRAARFAGLLILLAGAVHLTIGAAGVAGTSGLEANVAEIESNEDFGSLYFSLGTWGAIMLILGAGELMAAVRLLRARPRGTLVGILVASVGLAGAFAGLAIFRWAALAPIPLLLVAILILSRHERA